MATFEDFMRELQKAINSQPKKKKKEEENDSVMDFLYRAINQDDGIAPTIGGGGRSFTTTEGTKWDDKASSLLDRQKILDSEAEKVRKKEKDIDKKDVEHGGSSVGFSEEALKKRAKEKEEEKKDLFGLDLFQKGALGNIDLGKHFEDGWQFGDILKTGYDTNLNISKAILGTAGDTGVELVRGFGNFTEGIADAIGYTAADLLQSDFATETLGLDTYGYGAGVRGRTEKEIFNDMLAPLDKKVEKWSVLGDSTDAVASGVGQVGTMAATGVALGGAGVGAKAVSGITKALQGLSSFGHGYGEAIKDGANYDEARGYGLLSAGAEVIGEMLFSNMGKLAKNAGVDIGMFDFDDVIAKKVGSLISSPTWRNAAMGAVKGVGEGIEEWFTGVLQGAAKKATYMKDEDIWEIWNDENLWEQFFVGMLTGEVVQGNDVYKANKSGRDLITGRNADEQTVLDKMVEEEMAKAEKDGKKVKKGDIEAGISEKLEKGFISVDDIERILGGDSYNAYASAKEKFMSTDLFKELHNAGVEDQKLNDEFEALKGIKREDSTLGDEIRIGEIQKRKEELKARSEELRAQLKPGIDNLNSMLGKVRNEVSERVKDGKLAESYRELVRSTQKFQADPSKYKSEAAKKTIQNLVDGGIANNTNEFREFAELMAKISDDKGAVFDITDNKRLKGTRFAVKGATTNAFVTEDGNITINKDSKKRLNALVGHEITHVLEGTEFYTELQEAVKKYAQTKGEWDSRLKSVTDLYKKYKPDADPTKELTADLIGEYIFNDRDFVMNLSTSKNAFRKVFDEIKYLAKIATAGSKEARQLEKAKKVFEEVWKSTTKKPTKTEHSISEDLTAEQQEYFKDSVVRDESGNLKVMYHGTSKGGFTVFDTYRSKYGLFGTGFYFTDSKNIGDSYTKKGKGSSPQVYEAYLNIKNPLDMDAQANPEEWQNAFEDVDFPESGTNEQFYRAMEEYYEDQQIAKWEVEDIIRESIEYGMGYDGITHIGGGRVNADGERHRVYIAFNPEQIKNIDNQNPTTDPDIRYSLSEDSEATDQAYLDAVTNGDMATAQKMVDDVASEYINSLLLPNDGDEKGFKYHRGPTPTKTFKRYAVFNVSEDGFRAAYAGNKNATPVGVWLDSQNLESYMSDMVQFDDGTFASYIPGDTGAATKTKFSPERMEEYGLTGGQKWLMERGGKHSSDVPNFSQMNLRQNEKGEKVTSPKDGALPHNKLVFEIEYGISDDGDLTEYVRENGRMMKGKNQGLAKIGPNQYYDFKTNPNAVGNWGIGGTFRITRIVPHDEIVSVTNQYKADAIAEAQRLFAEGEISKKDMEARIKSANAIQVQKWVGGYNPAEFGITEASMNELIAKGKQMKLTDPVTYDDNGNVIPLSERFNAEKDDIRYSISEDSDGNQLTDEQSNFFADSKVVDENGSLLVMYHGTPNGSIAEFKPGTYFTANKEYADRYQNPGASSISSGKVASNPKTFAVYLNIKKPFDINDAEARRIYIEDYIKGGNALGINPYLSDAEYANINSIDWTEGEDLRDFLLENGYDYDGLILDEGGDGGYGEAVNHRGKSYMIFSPEQAKSIDNQNPTGNANIHYSISEDSRLTNEVDEFFNDSVTNKVLDNSAVGNENSLTQNQVRGETNDNRRIREGNSESARQAEANGKADPRYADTAQENQEWGSLSAEVQGRVRKLVRSHVDESSNYEDIYTILCNYVGKTDATMTPRSYEEAISSFSRDLFADAMTMDLALFEGRWSPLLGSVADLHRKMRDAADSPTNSSKISDYEYQQLVNHFGTTENYDVAGYLLQNGLMLDFSGKHWGDTDSTFRQVDHRDVWDAWEHEDRNGTDEMVNLISNGNIRLMPESGGINLAVMPNKAQLMALMGYINHFRGEVIVDVDSVGGNPIQSFSYNKGTSSAKIIADIKAYFENGTIPAPQSNLRNFLYSISENGDAQRSGTGYGVHGDKIGIRSTTGFDPFADIGPIGENVMPVAKNVQPVMENPFPDTLDPAQTELDNLLQQREALESRMLEAVNTEDFEAFNQINTEYESVMARIEELEGEIAESESGRIGSLSDADAPPVMDAPYDESPTMQTPNPFYERDMKEVGNRKVKAYMYENPEVKPFFQEAALGMLGDLHESVRGEKWYNDDVYYESGGEKGWGGTKRQTTDDIAELLDDWGYTYADIEKGLNAIIEDDGAENNACSKRIEFMLHDRLVNGHKSVWGEPFPPNQEYIDLLKERQINEYSEEAFNSFMESADQYAPPAEDFGPVANTQTAYALSPADDVGPVVTPAVEDNIPYAELDIPMAELDIPYAELEAPVKEEYEAIRPRSTKQPRMVRVDAPVAEQHTAQILDKSPTKPKEKASTLHKAEELLVDKGAVFERLAKKVKNRELEAKYNALHYSQGNAQTFIGEGDEDAGVASLVSIMEQVGDKDMDFFSYLYHVHNVDRMTLEQRGFGENKAVYGDHVTADMSRAIAQQYEAQNPEFKELASKVYGINKYLLQMMVDGGLISQETANLWSKMYPHYVPINRAEYEAMAVNVPLDTNKTGVNAPVKRATGGNGDISPVFDTMAKRIIQTFRAIDRNDFGAELMNTLGTAIEKSATDFDTTMDGIDANEELLQEGKNGNAPTFTVFKNGERVKFAITKEMYDAMKPTDDVWAGTRKVLNTISNIRRGLITEYNPVFLATNAIKDAQDVLLNSQHAATTYANFPKAWAEILGKGEYYREYMKHGGGDNTYFERETSTFQEEKSTLRKVVGFPLDAIAYANNFIERVPRLAEYIASREEGRSIKVSMLDAARVTTNFAAGGDVTKWANRNGATFLNASVQGARQIVRNVQEAKMQGLKGWAKLAGKTVLAALPAVLLNGLLWRDDEEYEELSDYVKENYYIVGKFGDGQFVRIPKGRTVAVIQEAFRQMRSIATGDDEADFNKFFKLVRNNLAPNNPLDNNVISPIFQAYTNKAWHGGDIVPQNMQDVPEAEQYDESTDALSKWLGEKLNISPMKLNYILDQYSGGVGDTLLPMATPEAERGTDSLFGKFVSPWVDKFTTDSVLNNQNVTDFYDLKDELTISANSIKATDEDVLKSKYMNSVSAELNALYKEKREIQNSLKYSDSKKYEMVRDLQDEINERMKDAMATHEDISYEEDVKTGAKYAVIGDKYFKLDDDEHNYEWSILSEEQTEKYKITSSAGDANYATDGETHYRWAIPGEDSDEEPHWEKITDKQLAKQNDVTEKLGITPDEYWSNQDEESKDKYTWVYDNPEKFMVASAVTEDFNDYWQYKTHIDGLDAKDAQGNTVNGLKKDRTFEYINSLPLDDGEKMIMFKSCYKADDSYNYEIIDYLNNRDDISYEEMNAILIELGFKIGADGRTITWD